MLASVVKPYTDRESGAVYLAGESVELTQARAAELAGAGYVLVTDEAPAPAPAAGKPKRTRTRKQVAE